MRIEETNGVLAFREVAPDKSRASEDLVGEAVRVETSDGRHYEGLPLGVTAGTVVLETARGNAEMEGARVDTTTLDVAKLRTFEARTRKTDNAVALGVLACTVVLLAAVMPIYPD